MCALKPLIKARWPLISHIDRGQSPSQISYWFVERFDLSVLTEPIRMERKVIGSIHGIEVEGPEQMPAPQEARKLRGEQCMDLGEDVRFSLYEKRDAEMKTNTL